jgi:hypothetical protein
LADAHILNNLHAIASGTHNGNDSFGSSDIKLFEQRGVGNDDADTDTEANMCKTHWSAQNS